MKCDTLWNQYLVSLRSYNICSTIHHISSNESCFKDATLKTYVYTCYIFSFQNTLIACLKLNIICSCCCWPSSAQNSSCLKCGIYCYLSSIIGCCSITYYLFLMVIISFTSTVFIIHITCASF